MEREEKIMMLPSKEYKNAGVMFVVFIIFLGAYLGYHQFLLKEPTVDFAVGEENIYVVSLDLEELKGLKVHENMEVLSFYRTEDGFEVEEEREMVWDQDRILDKLTHALKVPVDKEFAREGKDLSAFGLENPFRWVEYRLQNETGFVLEVGDETPSGGGYYVKLRGEDVLYITSAGYVERLFESGL
jgi:hypothetical protein